jgi:DNA-binding transcriptional LysR family regulator
MHAIDFDLNLLLALDALLTHRHVTRAAAAVGLSQPAMSHALSRLRDVIGDPLLVRGAGAMVLTSRAEALVPIVDDALGAIARVRAPARFDPKTLRRNFIVGLVDYSEMVLLPALSDYIAVHAPLVSVTCRQTTDPPQRALESGELDVWIGVDPPDVAGLTAQHLLNDTYLCAVRHGHPAVERKGRAKPSLSLSTFVQLRHIQVAPRGTPGGPVDAALAKRGLSRDVAVRVPHFLVAPLLLLSSDFVLTAPALVLQAFAEISDVQLFAPPLDVEGFALLQVWHERRQHDVAHAWFRNVVTKLMKGSRLRFGTSRVG